MSDRQRSNSRSALRRWLLRGLLLAALADALYLVHLWPDWQQLAHGPIPESSFMRIYAAQRAMHPDWTARRWEPVPLARMPHALLRAVIVGEDARFYEHDGFDVQAMREALDYNLDKGRIVHGASTISQQTVKNLFLSPSRDPLRKWHELVLTWAMERHLGKRRILELYLNIVEFGPGVYGAQAAAHHYWSEPLGNLSTWQAAQLAATLPSPRHDNPATRTRAFLVRAARIAGRM